jgi:hypothetical protein
MVKFAKEKHGVIKSGNGINHFDIHNNIEMIDAIARLDDHINALQVLRAWRRI